jgi:dolichol-phosphate mannosyltransferase
MTPTTIVIPTYNEAESLPPLVARLAALYPEARILVVDDASPDGTGAIAEDLALAHPMLSVLHRREKEGIGPAYVAGFRAALAAGAGYLVQMDADGSHDPADVGRLVAALDGGADVALGSRWVAGGGTRGWPLHRRLLSRVGSLYARLLTGIPAADATGGFKAWRAPLVAALIAAPLHAGGYAFQIETTLRAARAGARIAELPITFTERTAGTSKMSRSIIAEAVRVVFALRRGRGH